jgi:CHASE2 domain-containing sensor protein
MIKWGYVEHNDDGKPVETVKRRLEKRNLGGGGMSEPGHFSLERLVSGLPSGPATFFAAVLTLLAALLLSRDTIIKIPEFIEAGYGYDTQLRVTIRNRGMATGGLPVTFVDVDDGAIKTWGDATRTTPRDKLAEIIAQLARDKPKVVFVDFDLSGEASAGGDDKLKALLAEYSSSSPPLLLTRAIEPIDCKNGICVPNQCAPHSAESPSHPTAEEPSPFDQVTSGKENIIWVASVFAPDADGVVRSWRLWESVCADGTQVLLPSPQLVAAALASKQAAGSGCLADYLKPYGSTAFHVTKACDRPWPKNRGAYQALIPYLIGAPSKSPASDWLSTNEFRYQHVRAASLLADQVAKSAIEGRVIVVGASYGPDKMKTPFGVMPGAALIANAIAVAPVILDAPPRPYTVTVLTLLLAAAYTMIAKTFRAVPAAAIILAISYVWLSLSAFWLNPADAAATASMALILLGAFLGIESMLEIFIAWYRGEGFSALLRKHEGGNKSEHGER